MAVTRYTQVILLIIILLLLLHSTVNLGIPSPSPTEIIETQVQQVTQISRTVYDAFPGISRAIPGTFQRMLLRWINAQASASTTPPILESSTTTSLDSTSVIEIVANAARAARTASFIVAAVYLSCAVAILISRYSW
jgi:hypothetical protein